MTLMMTADVPDPATQRTLAGRGARLGAILIDACLFGAANLMPSLIGAGYFVLLAGVNLCSLLLHGQSIGKCLLKIAIVEQETNLPPGYMRVVVIRSGPQTVLSMTFPVAGLVYILIDGLLIFSKCRVNASTTAWREPWSSSARANGGRGVLHGDGSVWFEPQPR